MSDADYAMNQFNAEMQEKDEEETIRVTVEECGQVSKFELDSVIVVGIKHDSIADTRDRSDCVIQGTALGDFSQIGSRHMANGLIGILRSARLRPVKKYLYKKIKGGRQ